MYYFYEIYVRSSAGVPGWDIEAGTVVAEDKSSALARVKQLFGRQFDAVIQCHQVMAPIMELDCF